MSDESRTTVQVDALVQVSEKGKAYRICPKHLDRTGVVTSFDRDGMVRVRWNGLKTATPYHPSFIEEVACVRGCQERQP
jgi:hypothetical protein